MIGSVGDAAEDRDRGKPQEHVDASRQSSQRDQMAIQSQSCRLAGGTAAAGIGGSDAAVGPALSCGT